MRTRLPHALLALLLLGGAPSGATEAPDDVGSIVLDAGGSAVVLRGPIGIGSADAFDALLSANPGVSTVMLDSPGGYLSEGLSIADRVFERKLATYVPKDAQCASACSFVFLAGADRLVEGRLGVHQFYSSPETGGMPEGEVQLVAAELVKRLDRYGAKPGVMALMFGTTSDDMHFFTAEEIVEFGIDRGDFVANRAPARIASASAGGLLATYPGVAASGPTFAAEPSPDPASCAAACRREDACAGFVFWGVQDDPSWPNCHLRSAIGFLDVDSRALSGLVVPHGRKPAPVAEIRGIDPATEVFRDVVPLGPLLAEPGRAETAELCRSACAGDAACAAFAYETVGGRCSLLASVVSTNAMRGIVSGVRSVHRLPLGSVASLGR